MQFCGKRKITLNCAMFININGSCQCLQIKTFMSGFSSVYCLTLSKMVCTFWMTFCKNSIRISCQIIFVNKHLLQSCPSPFKLCVELWNYLKKSIYLKAFLIVNSLIVPLLGNFFSTRLKSKLFKETMYPQQSIEDALSIFWRNVGARRPFYWSFGFYWINYTVC